MREGKATRGGSRLCAVIVNFRTARLTAECVDSLAPQLDPRSDRVVVVDNGSGPAEVERLSAWAAASPFAGILRLLPLGRNDGFSAGNNAGIASQPSRYYLLANSDTVFLPGAVSSLLEAAGRFRKTGILSPRLEGPDGKPQVSCFRRPSPLSELVRSANTGPITRALRRGEIPLPPVPWPTRPAWTSFACALLRKELIEAAGFLDEGFFMYFEDVDYCRRARAAGFGILNWPDARVIHLQGQSSDLGARVRNGKALPPYYYDSRARYFRRYYGELGFLLANACWLLGRSVCLLRRALGDGEAPTPKGEFSRIWRAGPARLPLEGAKTAIAPLGEGGLG